MTRVFHFPLTKGCICRSFAHAHIHKAFISNTRRISLYLILKILFPPLWSDVGRKMLREFHFAGTTVPSNLRYIRERLSPFPVDATFVISVNLLAQHAARQPRRTLLLFSPLLARPAQCTPGRSRPTYYFAGGTAMAATPLLTGGRAAVWRSRWEWLSDFAPSLPGQVWGHCGPPSHWATATWLRQQSAQEHRALLGPPVKTRWQCGQGTPSPSAHIIQTADPRFIRVFVSGAAVWEASCCCFCCVSAMKEGLKLNFITETHYLTLWGLHSVFCTEQTSSKDHMMTANILFENYDCPHLFDSLLQTFWLTAQYSSYGYTDFSAFCLFHFYSLSGNGTANYCTDRLLGCLI